MKRDYADELYSIVYKRYREQYPTIDFGNIPNFLDSIWYSVAGDINSFGYHIARERAETLPLLDLSKINMNLVQRFS